MVKTIRVPKTPVSAYKPTRAASSLITAHIANLEAATRRHDYARPSRKHRNEAQAAFAHRRIDTELIRTPSRRAWRPHCPRRAGRWR
jgi:hypothetical protein